MKARKKSWGYNFATTAFILFSASFVLLGWMGHQLLLEQNPCKMTYSQPSYEKIDVNSTLKKHFTLLKQKANSGQSKLYPQPVLFIHGHHGHHNQVRSLASTVHNNHTFQYFTISARDKNLAYHGSSVLVFAIFLNEAISKIQSLYKDESPNDPTPSLIVIGHSLGGVVARTSLFLSNYPECAVSSILTIGSPSHKSVYTPDASHDTLLKSINRAWRSSFYFTSNQCIDSNHTQQSLHQNMKQKLHHHQYYRHNSSILQNALMETKFVTNAWTCTRCVPHTTLVSISGGNIDSLVPAPLTHLAASIPRHSNHSSSSPTPKKVRKAIAPEGGFVAYVTRNTIAGIRSLFHWGVGSKPTNSTSAEGDVDPDSGVQSSNISEGEAGSHLVGELEVKQPPVQPDEFDSVPSLSEGHAGSPNESESSIPAAENTSAAVPVSAHVSKLRAITLEQWNADMTPHLPSKITSIRTSQMASVGFPIDHGALLWCYELIHSITQALHILRGEDNKTSMDSTHLSTEKYMSSFFPLKPEYFPTKTQVPDGLIEPVEAELLKDAKFKQWMAAGDQEKIYFSDVLTSQLESFMFGTMSSELKPKSKDNASSSSWSVLRVLGTIWASAVFLFTTHLSVIFISYIVLCVLILSIPVWRGLSNISPLFPSQGAFTLSLSPWDQFYVSLFYPYVSQALRNIEIPGLSGRWDRYQKTWDSVKPSSKQMYMSMALGLMAAVYYDGLSPVRFMKRYGIYIEWLVGYGIALLIRSILLLIISVIREIIHFIIRSIMILINNTIWNKSIRKSFRLYMKNLRQSVPEVAQLEFAFSHITSLFYTSWTIFIMIVGVIIIRFVCWNVTDLMSVLLGVGTILMAQIYIVFFSILIICMILAIIHTKSQDGQQSMHLMNILLLYVPVAVLAIPSAQFSSSILFGHLGSADLSIAFPLFSVFFPQLIFYNFTMVMIIFHFVHALSSRILIRPVGWLAETIGTSYNKNSSSKSTQQATDSLVSVGGEGATGWSELGIYCVHEDGGKHAIYDFYRGAAARVSAGVLSGPAFRVFSCSCEKDTRLKSPDFWCSWCKCPKCGGKDSNRKTALQMRNFSNFNDLSADLGLGFAIMVLGLCSVLYAGEHPYQQIYILGLVALAFNSHRLAVFLGY